MAITMDQKIEMTDVIRRALEHYSERLTKLQDDKNIELGSDILRHDLETDAKESKDIANNLQSMTIRIAIDDHKDIIMSALQTYIRDLKAGIRTVEEQLGSKLLTKNTSTELDEADNTLKYVEEHKIHHTAM
jgi:predicted nucleic-acid-binding protein